MWVCMLLHANLLSFLLPLKHIFWYENMKGEIKMKDYYPEGTLIANEENKKYLSSEAFLQLAISSEKILEANVVMCDAEHNLIVDLGIMRGIIPRDEGAIGIREGTTRDIALISRVGRAVSFIVKEITNDSCGKKQASLPTPASLPHARQFSQCLPCCSFGLCAVVGRELFFRAQDEQTYIRVIGQLLQDLAECLQFSGFHIGKTRLGDFDQLTFIHNGKSLHGRGQTRGKGKFLTLSRFFTSVRQARDK